MNHVDCWQALTIWQSGMLWHGNWWKLPFTGRSSPIGDHVDNCLFDLCLKQLSLNTPFQHLIGIPWQMHVPQCPSGIPCPINWWKWQLPRQSSPIVRLNFAKVYFLCRALYILQLCVPLTTMTNKNKFKWLCKVSGIVCIQSLWSQWREEKSIFRSLHELSMVRFSL